MSRDVRVAKEVAWEGFIHAASEYAAEKLHMDPATVHQELRELAERARAVGGHVKDTQLNPHPIRDLDRDSIAPNVGIARADPQLQLKLRQIELESNRIKAAQRHELAAGPPPREHPPAQRSDLSRETEWSRRHTPVQRPEREQKRGRHR